MTRRLLSLLAAPALVLFMALSDGCDEGRDAAASTDSREEMGTRVPVRQPVPRSEVSLQEVDLVDTVYLAGLEQRITVSPKGQVRSDRVQGKGATGERAEVREGLLTPAQTSALLKAFGGWEQLDARYGGVPDGPSIRLRYGRKSVTAGSEAPPQVEEASRMLREIARKLPVSTDPSK